MYSGSESEVVGEGDRGRVLRGGSAGAWPPLVRAMEEKEGNLKSMKSGEEQVPRMGREEQSPESQESRTRGRRRWNE